MTLKKILAFAAAILLMLTLSACGIPNWQNAPIEENNSSSQAEINENEYEDNLSGLCSYLAARGHINGNQTEMNAQMIGAVAGGKYSFAIERTTVTVELYEFDTDNLDETAKTVIQSVKNDGKFNILGTEVEAILSNNGKYIMIYAEMRSSEALEAEKTAAIDAFKSFKS